MSKNSLFASQGSFLVGVDEDIKNAMTIQDLLKAKKAAAGLIEAPIYDMNNDGVVDEKDIDIIRSMLLA